MSAPMPVEDEAVKPVADPESQEVVDTTPELAVRLRFVFTKVLLSTVISFAALWAIVKGMPGALDTLHSCYAGDLIVPGNPDLESFGLCNFRVFIFALSILMTLPFLSESLLANMVFFTVITKGNIVSKEEQANFDYWLKVGRYIIPCFYTYDRTVYDSDRAHHKGLELLDYTLYKIAHLTPGERLLRHLLSLIGVFLLIPVILIWRSIYRSFQTIFGFPWLFTDSRFRKRLIEGWMNLLILPFIMASDPVNVCLLFPLSFVVIFTSQSPGETIVNLVAVQVFARLDDEFVESVFAPEIEIRNLVSLYFPAYNKGVHGRKLRNSLAIVQANQKNAEEEEQQLSPTASETI